jgi:hypothetical protein
MTTDAKRLLRAFESLSARDQREVADEIIRRSLKKARQPLTDEELVLAADDLFLQLDRREWLHRKQV